ncbi:MAG: carboxypeptidase regulatory-like domain-containing protein [Candidatus Cloacimonetes bacterium]|nr:carboxypeptidase regulatory-like domain-containing protein [Candidatus Cloacimonadota bacterium]
MKSFLIASLLLGVFLSAYAGTVQGYVTDALTNEPVYDAKVHFTTNDGQHICFDAYTDENGFYSMEILNETYNGRALKNQEYRVTLIEEIEINDGITVIDFELVPTSGNHNKMNIKNQIQNSQK